MSDQRVKFLETRGRRLFEPYHRYFMFQTGQRLLEMRFRARTNANDTRALFQYLREPFAGWHAGFALKFDEFLRHR